ncbi:hypothetical protein AA12717_3751 [Gluconacetobacter sacchari DSM 12717]|uniref:Uncharacterized protein n=2 Tax=Gluconacetobacter sacchari TaxID=92759 RepID=A0A7W4I9Y5_9PROT|nr:hypothetical protein [Gluconacetobacter sacchari]MBB2158986.1 hypothetical protein [Gluconacetobacter sacchari]GBQ31399.1 hypothetical protein AA12717_3751 [Gluconacetobacter sacchari DSM 12717]
MIARKLDPDLDVFLMREADGEIEQVPSDRAWRQSEPESDDGFILYDDARDWLVCRVHFRSTNQHMAGITFPRDRPVTYDALAGTWSGPSERVVWSVLSRIHDRINAYPLGHLYRDRVPSPPVPATT